MNLTAFKKSIPFLLLITIALGSLIVHYQPATIRESEYNKADIAWMITATALVFLMTPGLAFFYGGMVTRKNVISTMIKSLVAAGVVTVLWVVVGFSLCFGESINGIIGNISTYPFLKNITSAGPWPLAPTIPLTLFAVFQLMFAIITPGLVVGAVAERIKFSSYLLFIVLFSLFVYAPIAHWTWHPAGFLAKMGVLDFAGGTVVHISAGCAALAGAMVLKRRKSHMEQREIPPANVPYVLIGTGLLWFGWFGFNAGSAMGANSLAVLALTTTCVAAGAAGLSWMFFDVARGKKPSALGFCIGAVVGLVAITPGAGFVAIPQSIFIGVISAVISNIAVYYKQKSKLDDALDVFPCHGIGGMVGMLMTGIFATKAANSAGNDGLLFGNVAFFLTQLKALLIVVIYSFSVSYAIFRFINLVLPMRVTERDEELGLDYSQHDEKYLETEFLYMETTNYSIEKEEERQGVVSYE